MKMRKSELLDRIDGLTKDVNDWIRLYEKMTDNAAEIDRRFRACSVENEKLTEEVKQLTTHLKLQISASYGKFSHYCQHDNLEAKIKELETLLDLQYEDTKRMRAVAVDRARQIDTLKKKNEQLDADDAKWDKIASDQAREIRELREHVKQLQRADVSVAVLEDRVKRAEKQRDYVREANAELNEAYAKLHSEVNSKTLDHEALENLADVLSAHGYIVEKDDRA